MRINRRHFLQAGAAATAALALPFRAFPFSQSLTGIKKFVVPLPGLGPTGIPVLTGDTTAFPGFVTYSITAGPFTQKLHPDIPNPTKLWGYADASTPNLRYLGGVIVAKRGTPLKLKVLNRLPAEHILPVDETLVDQAVVPTGGRTDIIAVHLHGGLVFWDSDGGPFTWFSNNQNTGGFVHGPSFLNPVSIPGAAIYTYPNDQSARTIWYHDHAYSLTRTNVYAGLASAYLITDDSEMGLPTSLVDSGVLPGLAPPVTLGGVAYPLGIPLIVQDKTFWDPTKGDPDYPKAVPAPGIQAGDLWYPHVYEGALDADLPSMLDSDLPLSTPNTARWGTTVPGGQPLISTVPEYFSDTILVNGAPYPSVTVPPRRLRFRFINASQARFYNLQLYVADNTTDGITLAPIGELDNNGNPILAPTNRPGPAFIQIANECGFLPAPALFSRNATTNLNSNRMMGYKLSSSAIAALHEPGHHRLADSGRDAKFAGETIRFNQLVNILEGDPTIGNASRYNLLMAPAERPDVIIDFRGFAGQKLILYNDAPAPFPGGDTRNDYYVGAPDRTSIGGAPTTKAGENPDTCILMRFEVSGSEVSEPSFAETVTML